MHVRSEGEESDSMEKLNSRKPIMSTTKLPSHLKEAWHLESQCPQTLRDHQPYLNQLIMISHYWTQELDRLSNMRNNDILGQRYTLQILKIPKERAFCSIIVQDLIKDEKKPISKKINMLREHFLQQITVKSNKNWK